MHVELSKLGLKRDEHYTIAERTLKREVKSLTTLTDAEALAVWNAARKEASKRIEASKRPVSGAEAHAVLN
jgi:hypothetical protein